jgi:hypothetical protein
MLILGHPSFPSCPFIFYHWLGIVTAKDAFIISIITGVAWINTDLRFFLARDM